MNFFKKLFFPKSSWLKIQEKSNNAVVQVFSVYSKFNWLEPYKQPLQVTVAGSGFIINDDGLIVTNAHVVQESRVAWIQVPALGRKNIEAEIVGICPDRDLALLKIKQEGMEEIIKKVGSVPYLKLGDSDKVQRTDSILVLGYPLGQYYVKSTTGIVSGREHLEDNLFLQIDAAINPGSSGGPALNKKGEVIGICTAIIPTAQSVGYIIPINELKIIIDDLRKTLFLRKQYLGLRYHNSNNELASYLKNPEPGGLYISKVYKYSIADKAGLQPGDVIYQINGCKLDVFGESEVPWSGDKVNFADIVSRINPGQEIKLVLYREGQRREITFTFDGAPVYPIRKIYPEYERVDYEVIAGMVVMQLVDNHLYFLKKKAPDLLKYRKMENKYDPVLIISYILPGSELDRLQILIPGAIIRSINNYIVKTLEEFRMAVSISASTGYLTIQTENEEFIVLSFKKILDEELKLVRDYGYPLSNVLKDLVASVSQEEFYVNSDE